MSKYKGYSRRDFIKEFGTAAGLAIPFLQSEVAMGQTTTAPLRILFVPLGHGWGFHTKYQPFTGTEFNFNLPANMSGFQSIKNQCVFIDGLRASFWGNAHEVGNPDMLTSSVRFQTDSPGGWRPSSASLDYVIGQQLQKGVLRFGANYAGGMCYDNNVTSLPLFTDAQSAYRSIIDPLRQQQQQQAGGMSTANPNAMANSILLNMLGKDANRLLNKLSGNERAKMETYLNSLDSLGDRIAQSGSSTTDLSNIILPNDPGPSPAHTAMIDSYLDMIRTAFTLDTHRVAVLALGEGQQSWPWVNPQNGATQSGNTFGNDFHQEIAHYDKGPEYAVAPTNYAAYTGWVNWHVNKITTFVNRLSQINDVDGRPLIDNTLIVLTGDVGNGVHEMDRTVYTLIGGGSRIRRNRLIQTPTLNPRDRQGFFWGSRDINNNRVECDRNYGDNFSTRHVADLWVTVARLAGLNINTFGIDVYNSGPFNLA